MWVSIIPLGGVGASWEAWTTLATGAQVSLQHKLGWLPTFKLEVEGAADLATLTGETDPLAAIAGRH